MGKLRQGSTSAMSSRVTWDSSCGCKSRGLPPRALACQAASHTVSRFWRDGMRGPSGEPAWGAVLCGPWGFNQRCLSRCPSRCPSRAGVDWGGAHAPFACTGAGARAQHDAEAQATTKAGQVTEPGGAGRHATTHACVKRAAATAPLRGLWVQMSSGLQFAAYPGRRFQGTLPRKGGSCPLRLCPLEGAPCF